MPQIVTNVRMSPSIHYYYNVSHGVGFRRRNDRLDILMVQFFLNNLRSHTGMLIQPRLRQDGLWGSNTQAAIKRFQQVWNRDINSSMPRVAEDAIVSPAQGVTYANGTMTWTILALNALVGNEPNFGPRMFCRLHTHPDCPPELIGFFAGAPAADVPPASRPVSPTRQRPPRRRPMSLSEHRRRETGEGLSRPRPTTPPRPYNRRDPGVMWAADLLRPGRSLFTDYEYSSILETMEGTGDMPVPDRIEILRQSIEMTTGDPPWLPNMSPEGIREMLRQQAALGVNRRPSHQLRY